ncbi:MAG: hypothetical protein ACKVE4_08430 [Dissulfuribacterales bacterium]
MASALADHDPMTKSLLSRKTFFYTPFTLRLNSWDQKEPIWWKKHGNGTHINSILTGKQNRGVSGITLIEPVVKIIKT